MRCSIWKFRIFGSFDPITSSKLRFLGGTPLILDAQEFHPLHEIHERHDNQGIGIGIGIGYNKERVWLYIIFPVLQRGPAKIHEALSHPELQIFQSLTTSRTQAKAVRLERITTLTRVRQ